MSVGLRWIVPKRGMVDFHVITELARQRFHKRFQCIIVFAESPHDFLIRMERELNVHALALLYTDSWSYEMFAFGKIVQKRDVVVHLKEN